MDTVHASRFERLLLIGAIVLHLVTAWYSTGYHSEDEHHQTIGFAETWLGELPVEEQAWEYHARIRGTALPWIAVGVFKLADAIGLHDPFNKALLLRLLTAALAIAVTLHFLRAVRSIITPDLWKPFLVVTWALWFLPFQHVRFASETWSGLLFLLALAHAIDPTRARGWAWRMGACLALAVWVRPAVGLMAVGLIAWLVLVRKEELRRLVPALLSFLVVITCTIAVDSLFYRTPTCSILRYTHTALVGDPDHPFDTLPWYYYAPWIFKYPIPPIGLCILGAFAVLLWKDRNHVLVWCIVPFILAHTFIGHKEVRFLYPLVDLVPWLLIAGFAAFREHVSIHRSIRYGVIALLAVPNALALLVIVIAPAGNGRSDLARAIRDDHPTPPTRIAYLAEPDQAWRIALPHFYRPADAEVSLIGITELSELQPDAYVIAYQLDLKGVPLQQHPLAIERMALPQLLYTWGDGKGPLGVYKIPDR